MPGAEESGVNLEDMLQSFLDAAEKQIIARGLVGTESTSSRLQLSSHDRSRSERRRPPSSPVLSRGSRSSHAAVPFPDVHSEITFLDDMLLTLDNVGW